MDKMRSAMGNLKSTFAGRALVLALSLALCAFVLPACTSESGSDASGNGAADVQQAAIEVTLAIAANEDAGLEAQELTVALPEGATVYDALVESGLELQASDSEYGKFIESIAGVAGTANSGWVYSVNGEDAMVGCDAFELAAGDAILWSYISW
ncbi:MAG: DUF4430 domain-containing protein [Eggerthellaceae bacterium]|nr:DUF4430 domain-containing protein [Eggerthellaceae bacterium]